nr:type II secretion system F family protein [uncultured Blautia sp.]
MKAKLTNQELFYFCEQFSILLHSGISCAEGIQLMLEDSHTQKGRDFFQSLQTDYEENGSFYISLHNTGLFPDSMISYVKIGEETGCLDEVLNSLSLHYQQEMEISENIKSAITYPLLMLVMMAAVILILLSKVLPVFRQVFQQMGLEMNQFSNGLFHAGSMISQYSAVVFAVILVMIAAFAVLFFTSKGRIYLQNLAGHLPHIREISISADYARLTQAIAMGLHSGMDHITTLEMAGQLISQPDIKKKNVKACALLEEGSLLENALSDSELFQGMEARLITVGLRAGSADEVMNRLAQRYRDSSLTVTGNLISIVEPTIVIIFSVLIGLVLLSVMMPLLGILSDIAI